MLNELLIALPFVVILLVVSGYFSSNINGQTKQKYNIQKIESSKNRHPDLKITDMREIPTSPNTSRPPAENKSLYHPGNDALLTIINKAFNELDANGYTHSYDNFEKIFRVSKGTDNKWFSCYTLGYNHPNKRKKLNLKIMPSLELLLTNIVFLDSDLKSQGGRVLISKTKAYRKRV